MVGNMLKNELNVLFTENGFPAKVVGHPSRSAVFPSDNSGKLREFESKLVDEFDILIHLPNFCTLAHSESHVAKTVDASRKILQSMGY